MIRRFAFVVVLTIIMVLLPGAAADAAGWPEIPKAEWELTSVPGAPNAPAVVLSRRGELHFDDSAVSSYFEVYQRIKILNEEGRKYGTVDIPSSKFRRVKHIAGRTLLPDGRVVELDKDAKFQKKFSTFYKYSVHSFALPAVEVGAIVEFRYKRFFDSVIFAEPWYFDSELPTLRSEIDCTYPLTYGFAPVKFSPFGRPIKEKVEKRPQAHHVVYWMENLPPVPDEPMRFPFEDMASWALFIPQEQAFGGQIYTLLKEWKDAVEVMEGSGRSGYKSARGKASATKRRAKEVAAGAATAKAKAEAVYRFVRDEITTEHWTGVYVGDHTCDGTLKERRGDYADKALLLQGMLKAVKVDSSLGWIRPRDRGRTQVNLPTPYQFHRILVVAELDGQQVFLDPSDPALPFGELPPDLEGVPCLLIDKKKPEWVDTPSTPLAENRRLANLDLTVNDEGILAGEGKVSFTGHHAWQARRWSRGAEDLQGFWQNWLERRFSGYDIDEIQFQAPEEELAAELSWKLRLREDEALGDEVTLATAAPLALTNNPFVLPPGRRRSPVMLDFPDVDEVHLSLSWPEDWELDSPPKLAPFKNGAGTLDVQLATDGESRQLRVQRRLVTGARKYVGTDAYRALHELYGKAAVSDAEQIVLVRN